MDGNNNSNSSLTAPDAISTDNSTDLTANKPGPAPWSFDADMHYEISKLQYRYRGVHLLTLDIRADGTLKPGLTRSKTMIVLLTAIIIDPTAGPQLLTVKSDYSASINFNAMPPEITPLLDVQDSMEVWDWDQTCTLSSAYGALNNMGVNGNIIHVRMARWNKDPYLWVTGDDAQVYYVFTRSNGTGMKIVRFWYGCNDRRIRQERIIGADEEGLSMTNSDDVPIMDLAKNVGNGTEVVELV